MTDWGKLKPPDVSSQAWDKLNKEWPVAFDPAKVQKIDVALIPRIYDNKMPTHDPYTNPDSHIYYECSCGAILDPGTKSFASLNNHASAQGWKIRFGHNGYTPYCVKCGEVIE